MAVFFLYAEPSAFDAGKLDTNSPYGLTESERYLFNMNKKIEALSADLAKLKAEVNKAAEKSEGAASLLDGLSGKVASISQNTQAMDTNQSYQNIRIDELEKYIKESRDLELANQETIKNVLTELTAMVDTLNTNYAALNKRVSALENKKSADVSADTKNQFANISSEELSKEGEKLFANKEYNNSKKYFSELIARNYKPARNSYMLGEAEYFSEKWAEAITNYKKSVKLYDKADYMPRLLYHTAISFDKIGDTTSANQFYKLLKTDYPNSKEAKASPNRN
jgi:TolA-binding protein